MALGKTGISSWFHNQVTALEILSTQLVSLEQRSHVIYHLYRYSPYGRIGSDDLSGFRNHVCWVQYCRITYFCFRWCRSYNDLNGKLGWGIFLMGVSCFITNGLAVKFGKRPVFISGNLALSISSVWTSQMNSFNGLPVVWMYWNVAIRSSCHSYGKRVRSMTVRLPFYKAIMSR